MTFINFFSLSSKGCCIYPCSPACQNKVKKFINFGYYTINIWYQYVFVLQRDELFRAQNRTINYQNSVLISVSITLSSERSCAPTTGLKLLSSSHQKSLSVPPLLLCGILQQQFDYTNEDIIIYDLASATAWQPGRDCKNVVNARM